MSSDIVDGDSVMIVRACCKESEVWLGKTFIARSTPHDMGQCPCCHKHLPAPFFFEGPTKSWYSHWRLQKLPPAAELDVQDTKIVLQVTIDDVEVVKIKASAS